MFHGCDQSFSLFSWKDYKLESFIFEKAAVALLLHFPPSPSSSFGGEMGDFILVHVFVFKTMDGEKENALLAHSGLSHQTVFGHELSTTDIMPRGGLCFPFISPAKKKKKKES